MPSARRRTWFRRRRRAAGDVPHPGGEPRLGGVGRVGEPAADQGCDLLLGGAGEGAALAAVFRVLDRVLISDFALGKALHRPAFAPAPAFAVRALRGEMADLILEGARAVPAAARELGYGFAYPELPSALDEALG